MRILLTGGFGNIGQAVIKEAAGTGDEILVFEIDAGKNRRTARKFRNDISEIIYGDIRDASAVYNAVRKSDAVIHLAAILPPAANKNRELCMEINYQGTRNIVEAIEKDGRSIPLAVTSSVSVMGPTQKSNRLVRPEDPLVPTDYYSKSKIEMEKFLRDHFQNYFIFRIAGVLPTSNELPLGLIGAMFDLHPDARMEMIIDRDAALGLIHGVHHLDENKRAVKGRAFILGGGNKNGCQVIVKDFLEKLFGSMGLPVPDRKCFAHDLNDQYIDWYDTVEAEKLFDFQHHHIGFYFDYLNKTYGKFRPIIRLFRKTIMKKIVSYSPSLKL